MDLEARLDLFRWLATEGLACRSGEAILTGFCERLVAGGLPLLRAYVTLESLDPIVGALGFEWGRRELEASRRAFPRPEIPGAEPEAWLRSPLYRLLNGQERMLRRRLDRPGAVDEFPIFHEFVAAGATDYLAFKVDFGGVGAGPGMLSSWTTDRAQGFTLDDQWLLEELLPGLELAISAMARSHGADTLLQTYLGRDAARRVLDGAVERGVAYSLDAVLWASDLVGFTRLADTEPRERVIDLLNAYAEVAVDAVEALGGEVLKFTGDGVLAVFDRARLPEAESRALRAATRALEAAAKLGDARRIQDLPTSRLRIALHQGEVFYGNVGARSRLDFTVVGPAVNEAARLCDMCRSVDRDLVVSSAFYDAAGADRDRLLGLGRFALRGVSRPQQLYTLDELS